MGALRRVRSNPKLTVAVAGGILLLLAWIGWAVYVGTDKGFSHAVGVLIAWPALVAAAALVSLPLIGAFILVRRLAGGPGDRARQLDEQPEAEQARATESG